MCNICYYLFKNRSSSTTIAKIIIKMVVIQTNYNIDIIRVHAHWNTEIFSKYTVEGEFIN